MQLSLCGPTLLLAVAALQLQFLSANPMERLPGAPEPSVPSGMQSTLSLEVSKKPDPEAKGGGQHGALEMFRNLDANFQSYKNMEGKGKVMLTRGTLKGHLKLGKSGEKKTALSELSIFLYNYVHPMLIGLLKCDMSSIAKADEAMNKYLSDPQAMRWAADPQEKWSDDSLYTSAAATYTMLHYWGKIASAMGQVGHFPGTFSYLAEFTYDDTNPLKRKVEKLYGKEKMMAWKKEFEAMYRILNQFIENVMNIVTKDVFYL